MITNKQVTRLIQADMKLWEHACIKELNKDSEIKDMYSNIINDLQGNIKQVKDWIDSPEGQAYYYDMHDRQQEIGDILVDEIDLSEYSDNDDIDTILSDVFDKAERDGYDDIGRDYFISDHSKQALSHLKEYSFSYIRGLDDDVREGLRRTLFNGIMAGKSPYQTAKVIQEQLDLPVIDKTMTPRQRALMIAHTETARALNTGTLQAYSNYGVEEAEILTAGDSNVCKYCLALEKDNPYPLKQAQGLIPAHPLCRCTYTPVINHEEDIPLNPSSEPKS